MYSSKVRGILNKHWDILRLDESIEGLVPLITFLKGHSIRDRLVNSHFMEDRNKGTWLDRKPLGCYRCINCRFCDLVTKS